MVLAAKNAEDAKNCSNMAEREEEYVLVQEGRKATLTLCDLCVLCGKISKKREMTMKFPIAIVAAIVSLAEVCAGEVAIKQGANIAPNGDRLEVTSKYLRLNGRAIIPLMGEMHYSRVPRGEWAASLKTMKDGGISIVSTYVFWNHHEWKEGEYDFSGNRDLSAFLEEVRKAGMWALVRIGPWAHGECREGGFPDWLVDKFRDGGGKWKKRLRSRDRQFLAEVEKFWKRLFPEVEPHLWKNGGPVIGVQLENESRGPWPYYQALKALAVKTGYDVPMYTRTGWPRLNGPETTFGEMIPLYGDYAEGFWDRSLKSMPGSYKESFLMRPARTSSVIATEQLGVQKAEDAKGAEKYPYFTCELGGGMVSSYHRRLKMEPMDAFALAVVKLGSGSNLPGFYMYHGGTNPADTGANMAESQRGKFTNGNDLPVVSYEFQSPVGEFGEPQSSYWLIRALGRFCREYGEELAVEEPVFVNKHETRRGRFVFHNDYVRRLNPDGECWIGIEKDGKIERVVDGRDICASSVQSPKSEVLSIGDLKLLRPAGTPPPVAIGPAGVAVMPEESAWGAAAEYEVPFKAGDGKIAIAYDGDMARLYADGRLVQDDFWKGLPIRYALRRLPQGTKRMTLKVLPWGEGAEKLIFVDGAQPHPASAVRPHTFEIGESEFLLDGKPFLVRCGEIHYARIPREYWRHRLKMLRAMGCNAVGCYMFWNFHEREKDAFKRDGRADAAAFCRMAQEEGLWVILRPGPYSCAEWEGGGAPWWLMGDDSAISMRSSDPRWVVPATNWLHAVGRELAPLQVTKGGPILMVQVENEYGLHGNDVGYICALRESVIDAGFEVPLYACNPPRVIQNGFIPELFHAANFGADPEQRFEIVRKYQPKGPLMCAEYYPAWFDTWGQAHHPPKSDRQFFGPIDWMFAHRASFSLYMAHGGTSFGGWSGCRNPFIPNVTSYDYEAPINEHGRANPSFAKYRERAAKYLNPGETIADIPAPIPVKAYGSATLSPVVKKADCGGGKERLEHPVYSERLGMGFGLILWSADIPAGVAGDLKAENLHDFGYVYLDGKRIGIIDRRHRGIKIKITNSPKVRRLQILVEAMGRINSSSGMEDRKGLDGRVFVGKTEITDWKYELEPIDPDGQENPPGNWRGTFAVDEIADTFVDMRAFNKGIVWVNGKNLGRYWKIGPQQTLYLPGCWLKKGENEIVVREMLEPTGAPTVALLDHPILAELHPESDFNIVKREHDKFVGGEEVASGTFPNADAAQVVMLDKPASGTFFTFQILSTHDAKNLASIAEFDFLGADGNPLTSVDMQISGVDSEEEVRDDGIAENAIDGQVEAYWLSSSRTLPHWIEFRVPEQTKIYGFRYTPRQGNSAGKIKDWKLNVR